MSYHTKYTREICLENLSWLYTRNGGGDDKFYWKNIELRASSDSWSSYVTFDIVIYLENEEWWKPWKKEIPIDSKIYKKLDIKYPKSETTKFFIPEEYMILKDHINQMLVEYIKAAELGIQQSKISEAKKKNAIKREKHSDALRWLQTNN